MPSRIEDYALIGDLQTAALVGRDGSIDWLCVPRFDSPACFAALLGQPSNGRWLVAPSGPVTAVSRRYRGTTLILETEFTTADGRARVIDFMPPRNDLADVVRIVEGIEGRVPFRTELTIRFDYGSIVPWVRHVEHGIRATAGPDTLYCRATVPLRGENLHTVSDFTVGPGERVAFDLTYGRTMAAEPDPLDPTTALRDTESFWNEWAALCTYEGRWRDEVMRSLITLKGLIYQPTGGVVAAATTSLPERLGGVRNWDYRYCWLRDATFTFYALMSGGFTAEAAAWREWLVNAAAGEPSQLQIMYGIAGERRLTELQIEWLSGYESSRPVRIGNAAYRQHQLDVYGEIMDALHVARTMGVPADENVWRVQVAMMKFLASDWTGPDEGIWEIRGPARHFTHSKVMAWVAFDRAVKSAEQFGLAGPVDEWRRIRKVIHDQVIELGFDAKLNSFVQSYGSKDPDASLLMLPLVGFLDASDPRMLGTVQYVSDTLMQDGLLHRYFTQPEVDGLPPGEGTFLLCTFWLADNLALQGRRAEAEQVFERLLSLRNDVGLLSEEYSTAAKRFLGNFPQAFSHVGLINTAIILEKGRGRGNHSVPLSST
ncbi:MAG: glycoside hydrolase family 15 protein [Thermoanaerobaculia bacterium]